MMIEVQFPVRGETLPTDNAYLLYSALSHAVRAFHTGEVGLRFAPINGEKAGANLIQVTEKRSRLRLRLPADQIAVVLPLAGLTLQVGEHKVRLLPPIVLPLEPASM